MTKPGVALDEQLAIRFFLAEKPVGSPPKQEAVQPFWRAIAVSGGPLKLKWVPWALSTDVRYIDSFMRRFDDLDYVPTLRRRDGRYHLSVETRRGDPVFEGGSLTGLGVMEIFAEAAERVSERL